MSGVVNFFWWFLLFIIV